MFNRKTMGLVAYFGYRQVIIGGVFEEPGTQDRDGNYWLRCNQIPSDVVRELREELYALVDAAQGEGECPVARDNKVTFIIHDGHNLWAFSFYDYDMTCIWWAGLDYRNASVWAPANIVHGRETVIQALEHYLTTSEVTINR